MTSNDSRPSTCGAGNVEGHEAEQKHRAALAWTRRADALVGAPKRTADVMVVEYMDGNDADSLWGVLCVLQGRPNSEDGMAMLRQGVVTRVEGRH